jgi:hypothetical protein
MTAENFIDPRPTVRPVPTGPVRRIAEALNDDGLRAIATGYEQLALPEPPQQNVRNALQLLAAAHADPDGQVVLTPEELASIRTRLTVAVLQLDGLA